MVTSTRSVRGILQEHRLMFATKYGTPIVRYLAAVRTRIGTPTPHWTSPDLRGAEGNRTPDLLDANESRYQLRHSPASTGAGRRAIRA